MAGVNASGDGAGPGRDNYLWLRHRVISLPESQLHILRHRTRDQYTIRVPGRRRKLYAEPAQVENKGLKHITIRLARAAAAGAYLPELKGAPEYFKHLRVQRPGPADYLPGQEQVFPLPGGQLIVRAEFEHSGAERRAFAAEDTASKVQSWPAAGNRYGTGRADAGAFPAIRFTSAGVHFRQPHKSRGQLYLSRRESHRSMALFKPGNYFFEHKLTPFRRTFKNWPQKST